MNVAFDIDGTLRGFYDDKPREEIINLLKALRQAEHTIFIWSGGGITYARDAARRLGVLPFVNDVIRKKKHLLADGAPLIDMCFDDEEVNLAKVHVKV